MRPRIFGTTASTTTKITRTTRATTANPTLWVLVGTWLWVGNVVTAQVVIPPAIDVAPSQYWEGNDGPWSSFPIRVGTPAQDVRVFVSTTLTNTLVVAPEGCESRPSTCNSTRGNTFNATASHTWQGNANWGLYTGDYLGYDDTGAFGFDTLSLGYLGSGGPVVNNSVVAWILTGTYWIGQLGLNPRPTNFSTLSDPQPSFLTLLYEQKQIPSLAYSYTAGAKYRGNGVLASLTLGGYDSSLYAGEKQSFDFYFDQDRDLTVAIKAITGSNGTQFLPKGILSFIDSSAPQIWLPVEACDAFQKAFGLFYDNRTGLYTVNETQHALLLEQNSNITFTLAQTLDSPATETINITFPYLAFDKEATYPIYNGTARNFPLRRAADNTQYVLGRTFLQEAYLTVDYQRSSFSLAQRSWSNADRAVVQILPPANSTNNPGITSSTTSSKSSFGTGAIVGIVVAAVVAISIVILAFWFRHRKQRRQAAERESAALAAQIEAEQPKITPDPFASPHWINEMGSPVKDKLPELPDVEGERPRGEVDGTDARARAELGGLENESRIELEGTGSRVELGGSGNESRVELEGTGKIYELEAPHGRGEMEGLGLLEIGSSDDARSFSRRDKSGAGSIVEERETFHSPEGEKMESESNRDGPSPSPPPAIPRELKAVTLEDRGPQTPPQPAGETSTAAEGSRPRPQTEHSNSRPFSWQLVDDYDEHGNGSKRLE